ncbi:MAG TPA: hypothetical protein VGH43_01075 [Jatrophihabitans sp.]|jgi:hypothetical protein
MDRIWVRALVALATYLTYSIVLWLIGDFALVHGQGFGDAILYFDSLSLFAAVILGPAWIFQRFLSAPPGPRGRKGAVVRLPVDDGYDEPSVAA